MTSSNATVKPRPQAYPATPLPTEILRKPAIKIEAVGADKDHVVSSHWTALWCEVGMGPSSFAPDHERRTLDFISRARDMLAYQTFMAEDEEGTDVGSVSCQVWAGPQPDGMDPQHGRIGTIWAVYVTPKYRRQGIATRLVNRCVDYWRSMGCLRAVLLYASEEGKRVYERLGFQPGPMLAQDHFDDIHLDSISDEENLLSETHNFNIVEENGSNFDLLLADHFRRSLLVAGFDAKSLRPDIIENTVCFVESARERLGFRAFVAYREEGDVMASVCCQIWEGPFPSILEESALKFGSIWGLYVRPGLDSSLVGAALVKKCVGYLKLIGCQKVLTLCPTEEIESIFKDQCSFNPSNAMVLCIKNPTQISQNLQESALAEGATKEMIAELRNRAKLSDMTDQQIGWLVTANYNQIQALDIEETVKAEVLGLQRERGSFVDPEDNWFTQNVSKLGRGFDMQKLSKDAGLLSEKFDILAPKYNEWTLGNRSRVEAWVAEMSSRLQHLPSTTHIVDVCCGTGLMGHMIRLCGFQGLLSGCDISPKMVGIARGRKCYDFLQIANVNNGLCHPSGSVDVILCSGAMELLEMEVVVKEFSRLLRLGGELWVSFQADEGGAASLSTSHQNVRGITKDKMKKILQWVGFKSIEVQYSPQAFWTPSPALDGTLLPVPYYFVSCRRT